MKVEVETWCWHSREIVTLTLQCNKPPKGELARGKPTACNRQKCTWRQRERCLLNAEEIETKGWREHK